MTLVDRSGDLTRLVEEGFDVEIRAGNLLIHHVPYVTSTGKASHCILISELTTNGESTVAPGRHEVWVVGDPPHDHLGNKLTIVIEEGNFDYGDGLVASCRMSGKPHGAHPTDYHQKITTYVRVLGGYARAIDATSTHTDFPLRETSQEESVFLYHDAATSRSGLTAVARKLRVGKVAIVGLGGTGSYVLDLISKTPIEEIHLFDDDELLAHNAFRSPGAASLDELRPCPRKVDYLTYVYSKMRRSVVPHRSKIDENNLAELDGMNFVFLAMDAGPTKRTIVEYLRDLGLPFVDCGMGLTRVDNSLRGSVRTTSASDGLYGHVASRLSFNDVNENEYDLNLQTADLNMLNAAMAVIRWKKLCGYYCDVRHEHNSVYTVASNMVTNGDTAE